MKIKLGISRHSHQLIKSARTNQKLFVFIGMFITNGLSVLKQRKCSVRDRRTFTAVRASGFHAAQNVTVSQAIGDKASVSGAFTPPTYWFIWEKNQKCIVFILVLDKAGK